MNKVRNLLNLFMSAVMLITLSACVGAIEEADPEKTSFFDPQSKSLEYQGIVDARAISHDKIEVEFKSPFGTVDYSYYLHVNGGTGVKLNLEDLEDLPGGRKMYTKRGLTIDTIYKLKVTAEENETGSKSKSENELYVKTFSERTADFDGIQKVELVPGSSDRKIKVHWFNPSFQGTLEAQSEDPVVYEISLINANDGYEKLKTVESSVDAIYRRVPSNKFTPLPLGSTPTSAYVDGLVAGQTYYVRVRCIHENWYTQYIGNSGNPDLPLADALVPKRRDSNTRLLKIKMDDGLAPTTFNKEGLVVTSPGGADAYTSFNAYWASASGGFEKYRLYYKEYVDADIPNMAYNVTLNDQLDGAWFTTRDGEDCLDYATYGCKEILAEDTSILFQNLKEFTYYQVKLVVCRDTVCTLDQSSPTGAVISSMRHGRTEAELAPFGGVDFIYHPEDADNIDQIKLTFEVPVLSKGHADTMQIYCVDPGAYDAGAVTASTIVPIGGTNFAPYATIPSTTVGNCEGLSYLADNTQIDTESVSVVVRGVTNTAEDSFVDSRYCFAIAPAISLKAEQKFLDPANMVVRCINPEVKVPSIGEFPGLNNLCQVSQDTATVSWNPPISGIYNSYKAFWFEKTPGESFDYEYMISNAVDVVTVEASPTGTSTSTKVKYEASAVLDRSLSSLKIENLKPGRKYVMGVLATVLDDKGTPGDPLDDTLLFSEFNTGTVVCDIPLPKATFKEWTRIFAIGPKTNGFIPKVNPHFDYDDKAYLYEAINMDGIPYELDADPVTNIFNGTIYQRPPGNYVPAELSGFDHSSNVDAAPNVDGNYASNQGIVSIAWEDVSLEFLDSEYKTFQDNLGIATKSNRKYGYKVYRSFDNRLTWEDLTLGSGLVHADDYTYHPSLTTSETKKMAFFTDYSAQLYESLTGIEYARVYWYRIVPVFDDFEFIYDDNSSVPHHMIKVTLPPANMALVHRMMANRKSCIELGKDYFDSGLPNRHYSCDYDGLGSRPKGAIWKIGETQFDQGGDLLVDRFELGCNMTRGQLIGNYSSSKSYFDHPDRKSYGFENLFTQNYEFEGNYYSGSAGSGFVGCFGNGIQSTNDGSYIGEPSDNREADHGDNAYQEVVWGDCVGNFEPVSMFSNKCTTPQSKLYATKYSYTYPLKEWEDPVLKNCENYSSGYDRPDIFSTGDPSDAQFYTSRNLRARTAQAENFAVLLNTGAAGSSYIISPMGPGDTPINTNISGSTTPSPVISGAGTPNCYLNLASIGSKDGASDVGTSGFYRSRWVSASNMDRVIKDNPKHIYDMTVDEIQAETKLYGGQYQAPGNTDNQLPGRVRYEGSTKMAHIIATNSAYKAPFSNFYGTIAQKMCNNFEVSVGYSNGTNFFSPEAPFQKRLPRRTELIAMSAWPEDGQKDAGDIYDIDYTLANTRLIEGGTLSSGDAKSCVNSVSAPTANHNLYVTNNLSAKMAIKSAGSTYLLSGSSHAFSNNYNSEKCVSAFGVQDVIGNLLEVSSEKITCDYVVDDLYWGQHTGNSYNKVGFGDSANSISVLQLGIGQLSFSDNGSYNDLILKDAPIEFVDNNGDPAGATLTGNQFWGTASLDSGYCSIANQDSDQYLRTADYRDISSGIFKEVTDINGNLNTTMIPFVNSLDVKSYNYLRDGDGFFMNFGPQHLLVALGFKNQAAITNLGLAAASGKQGEGNYFNPVVGFPVNCGSKTPIDGVGGCGNSTDNRLFPMSKAADIITQSYPVGNSQIFHLGLNQWDWISNVTASITQDGFYESLAVHEQDIGRPFIEKFVKNVDTGNITPIRTYPNALMADGVTTFTGDQFVTAGAYSISRDSVLEIYNQGSYKSAEATGRFSASINKAQKRSGNGFRCVVKINEDL